MTTRPDYHGRSRCLPNCPALTRHEAERLVSTCSRCGSADPWGSFGGLCFDCGMDTPADEATVVRYFAAVELLYPDDEATT